MTRGLGGASTVATQEEQDQAMEIIKMNALKEEVCERFRHHTSLRLEQYDATLNEILLRLRKVERALETNEIDMVEKEKKWNTKLKEVNDNLEKEREKRKKWECVKCSKKPSCEDKKT